jgi:hypothetical protein
MLTTDQIISLFGGSAELSRQTKFPLTTIEGWKSSNFIPVWRQPALIVAARKRGKKLKASDFPPVSARISRRQKTVESAAA